MNDKMKGIVAVSVGSILLGSIGIFVRYAGDAIEPMTQSFGRIFVAFIFITLYNFFRYKGSTDIFKIKQKDLGLFALNALVGFSVMASAFTLSALNTSLTNTYFLLYTAPIWVVIMSYVFLKEKVQRSVAIAIAISMIGLILLFNPSDLNANLFGNFFGLVTGIAFATYFVITGFLSKKYKSPTITFWTQLIGSVGIFPLIFLFDSEVVFFHSLAEWLPVIGAGAVVFAGYALLNYGLGKIKASVGSILSLFEPLSSIVFGFLFFTEIPGGNTLLGSAIVLGSIAYLTLQEKKD